MDPGSFFAELKRRNVYKVAAAYGVVAWLLIQAASIILPTFEAPAWTMKVLIAALAIGLPIAIVLAWAFEVTPEGIKRAGDVSPDESITRRTGRKLIATTIALALVAAGLLAWQLGRPDRSALRSDAGTDGRRSAASLPQPKSIAVLPFENRSEEKANAYFADGIQDEILTRLAKIDDLTVISRTSTQRYKGSPQDLPEIARQLGVAHVLEGSVQKSGDQVRVNVQLINAQTDAHLWAEVYDRKVADIFAVQSEIAETIARALQVKLSKRERQAVAAKPTENPEAYDAYLRGLAVWMGLDLSPKALQEMDGHLTRAVQLDPKFALAWAHLSAVHTLSYAEFDPRAERLAQAKRAVDTAFQLQPGLGEAHFALGLYRYRGLRDFDGGLKAFDDAIQHGVNKALSLEFSSYVKRRQGKWDEALALNEQTQILDPLNVIIYSEQAVTYYSLRRYREARVAIDRALELSPNDPMLFAQKARMFQAEGDLEAAEPLLERVPADPQKPELMGTRYRQLMCTGRFEEALRFLEGALASPAPLMKHLVAAYRARLGFVRLCMGDRDGGRRDLLRARDEFEAVRQSSVQGDAFLDELILVDGLLGDRARVEASVAKLPQQVIDDAFAGPDVEQSVAVAWAHLGDADTAIAILERLLKKPGPVSCGLLRVDPLWNALRSDPRFQKLCREHKP